MGTPGHPGRPATSQDAARPLRGLSENEAARRLVERGLNELPPPHRDRLIARLLRQLREPMALLLIAAATVSAVGLGETLDATAIALIVVLNAVIALVQEGRATRALEALESLQTPVATVRRDGIVRPVPAAEVVPGDVVVIHGGDRVPADLVLVESAGIEVNESVLTGESLAVPKRATTSTRPGEDQVWAGTLVTRGHGAGTVARTGAGTRLGELAVGLRAARRAPTPLQRELASLTTRLGLAAVVVAVAVFAATWLRLRLDGSGAVEQAFLSAVALAVAAVPEGLAAVTSVALALGVRRMAERGAIVRRLPAVETLGSTTVLAIDKTGTVTENRMQLSDVVVDGRVVPVESLEPHLRQRIVEVAVLCNDAEPEPPSGDPMELALLSVVAPEEALTLRAHLERFDELPFDEERRRMTTFHRRPDTVLVATKGAPEVVIARCATVATAVGERVPMDAAARDRLDEAITELARGGRRVLALASREVAPGAAVAEDELELLALVGLRDPARASAPGSVRAVRGAGVVPIMITGDHPETAVAIATEVGLGTSKSPVPTGDDLARDGVPADPAVHPVYARISPTQKLDIVRALQAAGHTVGMTGDGVNDAPALRTADIGVALGRSGSDVAREAADLVIVDDDLATIVVAISEGRAIYDNLRKVVDYLVASNLAEVTAFVVALAAFPAVGVPLLPLQLLWMNLLTDGLPALALGVDPPAPGLMDRPPRRRGEHLLEAKVLLRLGGRGALLASAALTALVAVRWRLDASWQTAQTVLFSSLVITQVLYAFAVRLPERGRPGRNRWLSLAVTGALALQVLVVEWGPAQVLFDTVSLDAGSWIVAAVAGAVPTLVLAASRRRPHLG